MLFIATPAWSLVPIPGPRACPEGHEINALKPNTRLDPDDFGPVPGDPANPHPPSLPFAGSSGILALSPGQPPLSCFHSELEALGWLWSTVGHI